MAPNVVVIMMDDLAYGDLACHGNEIVRTPRLDGLWAQSARLVRYCSGPLCTPARASLMTGRCFQRTRAIDTFCGRSLIDPSERTIGHVLGDAGMRTGAFGKWHLGDAYPMRATDMGFAETLVHNAGGIGQPGDHRDNHAREGEAYFDPILFRDGIAVRQAGYCTDVFTDAAIDFVTRCAHESAPFLCYLATNAPHTPLEVPDEWVAHYRDAGINPTHARLYGMVENIDWNVGRLLDRLDELGIADDTIVVYTSDHGPCQSARDRSAPADRQQRWNAGLRGEKGTLYEGAIRVPSFWRWPKQIVGGRDVAPITSPIDVLPTLAAAVGATLEPGRVIDGRDLLPLLTTTAPEWPDRELVMQWHRGNEPERGRSWAVITQRWKAYRPERQAVELYDIEADPGESADMAADHADVITDLEQRYERWFDDVVATVPGGWGPPRMIVGSQHERTTVLTRNDWRVTDEYADWGEVALWRSGRAVADWEIEVAHAGRYRAEVRLEPFVMAAPAFYAAVVIDVDGAQLRTPWELMVTRYDFTLELPAGPARVTAWAEGPVGSDVRQTALYIDLTPAI